MKFIPKYAVSHADSKTLSRFFVSLTVFERLDFENWMSGGAEISRHPWFHIMAVARLMKFGILIELNRTYIFPNYAEPRSRKPWLPEAKNYFQPNTRIFNENGTSATQPLLFEV